MTVSNFRAYMKTRENCIVSNLTDAAATYSLLYDFVANKGRYNISYVSPSMSFNSVPVYVAHIKRALHRVVWEPLRRRATFWVALVSRQDYGRCIHILTCTHVYVSTHAWCTSARLRTYTYVSGAPFYTRRAYITRNISSAHSCSIPLRDRHRDSSILAVIARWYPRVHRYSGTWKPSRGIYNFFG